MIRTNTKRMNPPKTYRQTGRRDYGPWSMVFNGIKNLKHETFSKALFGLGLSLVFGVLLGGCTSVSVTSPNPRIQAPEALGEKGFGARLAGGGSHEFTATQSGGARPPDLNEPDVESDFDFDPSLVYAPIGNLEFGGEVHLFGRGLGAVGKWQILGDGLKSAGAKNFSLAVFGRLGTTGGSNSGDQKSTFGDGGYKWKGSISNNYVEAGSSAGYRVTDIVGFFLGGSWAKYSAKVKIEQDATDGGTDAGGSYSKEYSGSGATLGGGVQLRMNKAYVILNAEHTKIKYDLATSEYSDWTGGLSVVLLF